MEKKKRKKDRATPAGIRVRRSLHIVPRRIVSRRLLIKILVIRGSARARISDPFEIESKGSGREGRVEEDRRTNEIVMQIISGGKQKLLREVIRLRGIRTKHLNARSDVSTVSLASALPMMQISLCLKLLNPERRGIIRGIIERVEEKVSSVHPPLPTPPLPPLS